MALLLSRTSIASRSRSPRTRLLYPFVNVEPGPREKALLVDNPSLKPFASHKKSVWRLKRVGDVLTIIVVAVIMVVLQ